jgi:CheY-like chemotaxis protein
VTASILVVDDNHDNLALVDCVLRADGYAPLLAEGGREGLRRALAEQPDLVLLDIQMPELDGFEVADAIRADAALARTRIVAVTANAMVGDRERILAAGFDGYITKPISVEAFVGQIEQFLPADRRTTRTGAGSA